MFSRVMLGRVGARALSTSAATAVRRSQHSLLGASAVAAGVAAGVYGYQSECLKIDIPDETAKALMAALSKGSKGSKATGPRYNTLMPSPAGANIKCCVVEVRAAATALVPTTTLQPSNLCAPPRE
jgi:hypothetical protein